jgi:hypothetical protein
MHAPLFQETPLAKPNYRHAKKQKEAARKARQDAKQQRKANPTDAPAVPETAVSDESGASQPGTGVGGEATPAP